MDLLDPSLCVLVVEDESLIRMDVAATAKEAGFKVYVAANADEALRALDQHADIRILLTDVEMPGSMDGLALAHYASARAPAIKIIVTSGRRRIEAKDLPAQAVFLGKPCPPALLVSILKSIAS